LDNISKLSNLGNRTVTRFFSGENVKFSTVEKIYFERDYATMEHLLESSNKKRIL